MIAQHKLLRVLRLIALLKRTPRRDITQLASILETSTRTVYRYLDLLEEAGFIVEKDFEGYYFLFTSEKEEAPEVLFAPEETQLLRDLLTASSPGHLLTDSIIRKLYINSELMPLPENLLKVQNGLIVRRLLESIRTQRQVILKKYHSANSNSISDRLVEPLELTDNYQMLSAYEPASKETKLFKTERIMEVEVLEKKQTRQDRATSLSPDPFGMVGPKAINVILYLNRRAAMLLKEEYPRCEDGISYDKASGSYCFRGQVQDYKGIGWFIMGLPGEVEVFEPDELKEYLRERVKSWRI